MTLTGNTNAQRGHGKVSPNQLQKVQKVGIIMIVWRANNKLDSSVCIHEETFKRQVKITSPNLNMDTKHLVMPGAREPAAGMKQDMSQ